MWRSVFHRGNSVVDLSASTNGGAVMLLRSPLMVAIDCANVRSYCAVLQAGLMAHIRRGTASDCFAERYCLPSSREETLALQLPIRTGLECFLGRMKLVCVERDVEAALLYVGCCEVYTPTRALSLLSSWPSKVPRFLEVQEKCLACRHPVHKAEALPRNM